MARIIAGSITDTFAEGIVVNLFEGVVHPAGATAAVDRALGGRISEMARRGEFKGRLGECAAIATDGEIGAPWALVTGLGPKLDFGSDAVRKASKAAAEKAAELGLSSVATVIHGAGVGGLDPISAARAVLEGASGGTTEVIIIERDEEKAGEIAKALGLDG